MDSQRIPAVVPGIGVVNLHPVQIPGDGRGAAVTIGVGLDQQRALPPGDGGEGGDAHAEDLFRLRQQLIRPAVEQIVVLALVKAQLRALEDPQALALAFLPDTAIALQEGADPVAFPGRIQTQIVKGGAVKMVGYDESAVTRGLVPGHDLLCLQPPAAADVGGVQVRFDHIHGQGPFFCYSAISSKVPKLRQRARSSGGQRVSVIRRSISFRLA